MECAHLVQTSEGVAAASHPHPSAPMNLCSFSNTTLVSSSVSGRTAERRRREGGAEGGGTVGQARVGSGAAAAAAGQHEGGMRNI